jgi:glutamate synthase domain-containing protein 1
LADYQHVRNNNNIEREMMQLRFPKAQGLYDPANEHDNCGIGFVAHIKGQKSHDIIERGLEVLRNMDHRGATSADNKKIGRASCRERVY